MFDVWADVPLRTLRRACLANRADDSPDVLEPLPLVPLAQVKFFGPGVGEAAVSWGAWLVKGMQLLPEPESGQAVAGLPAEPSRRGSGEFRGLLREGDVHGLARLAHGLGERVGHLRHERRLEVPDLPMEVGALLRPVLGKLLGDLALHAQVHRVAGELAVSTPPDS